MSSLGEHDNANRYWRSLAELTGTAEFDRLLEAEFPGPASPPEMTRRRWLQLMGASLALAGAGGCRWRKAEILPLAERPGERTPGKRQRFATAMDLAGSAIGLLVTCVDGRPVKIEGNPKHPASLGATDALAQATILQLYDPDRSQHVVERSGGREIVRRWEEFTRFVRADFGKLREKGGAGFRVLAEADSSPTLTAMRSRLSEVFPEARWHEYEPLSRDNEREGLRAAFDRSYRTHFALDEARVIACLDADPLGSHPASVRYARDFARGRAAGGGPMNRLYAVESCLSLTGAAADHRLSVRSDRIAAFVAALQRRIAALLENRHATEAEQPRRREEAREVPGWQLVSALAEDLVSNRVSNRGRSVVAAGPRQPADVHAAVARINAALGNVGSTVSYLPDPEPQRPSHVEAIEALVDDMRAGKVQTLLVLGGNPAYSTPADLDFLEAFRKVNTRIHLGLYRDETSRASTWHVPQAHFLESWGDARAYDGTYGVIQPTIAPLYGGKSSIELLAAVLGDGSPGGERSVRETFGRMVSRRIASGEDVEATWRRTLHDGLLPGSAWTPVSVPKPAPAKPADQPDEAASPETGGRNGDLEIVFCRDPSVYDGRLANNGWLQEMPDPITRLTWGNAALFSPATAKKLGVEDQALVRLTYQGREVEMPAYVVPGQADGSVAVPLGYGRTAAGHVGGLVDDGVEPVGVNVYRLRTSDAPCFATGLTVEPAGKRVPLATVQDHYVIDAAGKRARDRRVGRLVREATLEDYRKHPDFAKEAVHHPPLDSLWSEHEYKGYRWGMAIDLSKCIGCGACVVACQAENNIAIVGRERVLQGREMHWIRVDRYFRGEPGNPQVVMQPVACHHCELAPCEQVCPVAATLHDAEGLNVMVYNRCVGTRYCANNCPYKIRRFNYFNYHEDLADPANEVTKMVFNPEVTVRSRGVMEKCTFCVQRIKVATVEAKNNGRRLSGDEVKTACQQVCPTGAIVFGDLADEGSAVARSAADDRSYMMLAELNVKPRTTYLARIRNPNPKLRQEDDHGAAGGEG